MDAISYTSARANLASTMAQVCHDHAPIIITRKSEPPVVMMSLENYLYWKMTDKKMLKRINVLIKDIQRSPYRGIGKPEPLKHGLAGYWSRRINDGHRIVYKYQDDAILIAQLGYHYST